MSSCDACGKSENMPYQCHHCGGTFCAEHRLPEAHDCPGLQNWSDPDGVFDSGFDDSVDDRSGSRGLADRLPLSTGPGGIAGYFRGNVTYLFLGLMWATFLLEHVVAFALAPFGDIVTTIQLNPLWRAIFVLTPQHPEYVWTWITSVFAHQPLGFWHIAGNSIIIFFFGRIVEDYLGSRRFAALFLVSGVLAGLSQIALSAFQGSAAGVLGASGAGLAIMAFLSVINPDLRVYLWFLIPVPIWVITIGYFVLSVGGIFGGASVLTGNVANMGHLAGLLIGLAYGVRMKGERRAPQELQFGGNRGPGGPGRGRF